MKVMATPRSLDLAITNKCNLRCKYCYHFTSGGDAGQDLPEEEWLKFFEELNTCGILEVCLSGGEPFVREDLKNIIEGIVQNRMRFAITSNGTLITDNMASFISSTGRCNYVQISIDGSIPIIHDSYRGKGTFQKAIEGIKTLQKHNISLTVRVTIHKQNVKDMEEISRLLLEEIGLPGFSTNSAAYIGLCRQNSEQVMLSPEDRTLAMETLLKLTEKYNGRISAQAGPLAEGRAWLEMERARREGKSIPGKGHLVSCGGVFSKLAVRPDGVIIPCSQMPHIELGRINKDSLKDLWQNHPELKRLRERKAIPLGEFDFCKGCDYINYCPGGCPVTAYTITGKENHPSPEGCLRKFLEEGGRLPELPETCRKKTEVSC